MPEIKADFIGKASKNAASFFFCFSWSSSGFLSFENKKIDFNDSTQNDLLRANKIGIIYQQDNLLPDFTSLENIYLAGLAAGQNKASSILKAKALLKKVGLINRLNHYPSELSGGEKQRVSIARAVINEPEIILADEPTGSLDHETAKEIFDILKKQLNKERIIIFATHNRFFANKADCLLELVNGNIKTTNAWVEQSKFSSFKNTFSIFNMWGSYKNW